MSSFSRNPSLLLNPTELPNPSVAHALVRAASRLVSTRARTGSKSPGQPSAPGYRRKDFLRPSERVEMSLDAARTSACATILLAVFALGACAQQPPARKPDPALNRAESLWNAKNYVAANDAFRDLVKANPSNPDYRVRWGRLFLDRSQPKEAGDLFKEALEIKKDCAGAYLGLAIIADQNFDSNATDLARKALEADPNLLEARELIARLHLEDNNPKEARQEADAALKLSPDALDAMSVHAAADLLEDKPGKEWLDKVFAKDAHYGKAYETIAFFFVLNRRYEEGIQYYRKAIALEPDLWSAHSQLGVNLMRLGREGDARQELELSYNNGFQDAATRNTLTLMDSYKNFTTFETDRTILRLHKKEADALRPYFESEMKHAMDVYDKKYQMHLNVPVQVEVYPDHEDFAVRTMGMPGLGALGVTFGAIVAMDSPSGRRPGEFHWASTMWHEMSHVYVLTMTKHRVPRWFTEGVAVHEETAIYKDWGDRLSPEVIKAIKEQKLLPVADLDRGFIHPSYPSQVVVSYFQGGQICDYISRKWGEGKLLAMIHDYAALEETDAIFKKELQLTPAEFDKQFMAWLNANTKKTVEGYEEWRNKIKTLDALAKDKKYDEIIKTGLAIRDIYPDYVEAGNVYAALSDAYVAKGDKAAALDQLERYSRAGGRDPGTIKKLATMLEEANRPKDAAAALARLNYIMPLDADLHKRLGALLLAQNDGPGAVREYESLVAMKPQDQAGARYDLARAYHSVKRDDKAREQVELSLEAAPTFKPAQKLLLELSAEPSK